MTETLQWQQLQTCTYPVGWELSVSEEQLTLQVSAVIENLDILVPDVDHYYEGETSIAGSIAGRPVSGRGVVELTWFCDW